MGFRPTLHRYAMELGLSGWVLNSTTGVVCEVEGQEADCIAFYKKMLAQPPPLARITSSRIELLPPVGFTGFHIRASEDEPGEITLISPDTAVCPDCAREVLDPADRRFRYPFINCTNCGPRYSISEALPYDRPNTTMREFAMCPRCREEYENPDNRRYHAQPNACPDCGPQVELLATDGTVLAQRDEAVRETVRMLAEGAIIAVKGLGGFHLACDALNDEAVKELRRRKKRAQFKPLAVMVRDFSVLLEVACAETSELELLASPISPIVLLPKRGDGAVHLAPMVAPRTDTLGVMIPYTPLHLLLFNTDAPEGETLKALVMTSANLAEEPLVYENEEALERLGGLADAFLVHNRRITAPSDDSIVRVMAGAPRVFRLGRGYAPYPIALSRDPRIPAPEGCAVGWGPDMKATFAMQAGRFALISPHLGDQETLPAQAFHRRTYEHFKRVFRQQPDSITADLHPGYHSRALAVQEAKASGAAFADMQHHHAHLASVMLENGLDGDVIALALDGTGFGTDGAVWGGEVLVGSPASFRRVGTMRTLPLPGGEASVKHTWRLALALLHQTDDALIAHGIAQLPPAMAGDAKVVADMLQRNVNCVPCTSLGRLFDAFSALLGICGEATYEAQAAIELEAAAARQLQCCADVAPLPFAIHENNAGEMLIDYRPAVIAALESLDAASLHPLAFAAELSPELAVHPAVQALAAGFIAGVARAFTQAASIASQHESLNRVVLSGGCFQNKLLLEAVLDMLRAAGLEPYTHSAVPMNDAGVSLGQLAHELSLRR